MTTSYRLSRKAEADVARIARISVKRWGDDVARAYAIGLAKTFQRLAQQPGLGRRVDAVRPGILRFEVASHVAFYRQAGTEIFIVRVLHERMDAERYI